VAFAALDTVECVKNCAGGRADWKNGRDEGSAASSHVSDRREQISHSRDEGDLVRFARGGEARQDLFSRLNVFPIRMPPLRERVDDIPLLVEYSIDRYAKKVGKKFRTISKKTFDLFETYDWPGNVRELQNVIERAVVLCDGDTFSIDETWLKRTSRRPPGPEVPLIATVVAHEKELIEAALAKKQRSHRGSLGCGRQTGNSAADA
jgi:DNA-binding NtrC family response regulator